MISILKNTGLGRSVKNHKSSLDRPHDYLMDMVLQIKKGPDDGGWFDGEKWIRSLNWNGNGWEGFGAHDWKYAMHMQEGACWFSIIHENNELDKEIESEFKYMHSRTKSDGTVIGIPDAYGTETYEYGLALSSYALGYLCFQKKNPSLAKQCYSDMEKIYNRIKNMWKPKQARNSFFKYIHTACRFIDDYHYILIGFALTWKAFHERGDLDKEKEVKSRIISWANLFRDSQEKRGKFTDPVQANEKIDLALCLSYDATKDKTYLAAVKKNLDWIIANRMRSNGGLYWSSTNTTEYYECHQLWFILACRLLMERNPNINYSGEISKAWNFLTKSNWANIDWYIHNKINQGYFFAYRNMNGDGQIQIGTFKGSYEIGLALWSLSSNYSFIQMGDE